MLIAEPRGLPGDSWRWLLVSLMILVAAVGTWQLWADEVRVVRARIDAAAAALTPPQGEPDMQRIVRIAGLAKLLAPDVVVTPELGGPEVRGRETVAGLAAQLSGTAGIRKVSVREAKITFDDTKTRATVAARFDVATADRPEPREDDAEPVTMELRKIDGQWLIAKALREPILTR